MTDAKPMPSERLDAIDRAAPKTNGGAVLSALDRLTLTGTILDELWVAVFPGDSTALAGRTSSGGLVHTMGTGRTTYDPNLGPDTVVCELRGAKVTIGEVNEWAHRAGKAIELQARIDKAAELLDEELCMASIMESIDGQLAGRVVGSALKILRGAPVETPEVTK
jgi:hypothetical protein